MSTSTALASPAIGAAFSPVQFRSDQKLLHRNKSGIPRRTTLTGYRSSVASGGNGGGVSWPAPGGRAGGMTLKTLRRLAEEGKLTMQRRKLLGLPTEGLPPADE